MVSPDQAARIRDAIATMLGRPQGGFTGLDPTWVPIDLTPENEHESRDEFVLERDTVKECLAGLKKALDSLLPTEPTPEFEAMRRHLTPVLGAKIRAVAAGCDVKDLTDLVTRNVAEGPALVNSVRVLVQLEEALETRAQELEDQRKEFWGHKNRTPHHYTRAIALRLARLYARELGKKPTYGTSSQGSHPSTNYTRALEAIYDALGIKTKVVWRAKVAIGQLTDADFRNEPRERLVEALLAPEREYVNTSGEPTLGEILGRTKRDAP